MLKRSGNYRAKNKMIRSYTHSDVRNAFLKSATKQLTVLPQPVKKCVCILEFEAGLITAEDVELRIGSTNN